MVVNQVNFKRVAFLKSKDHAEAAGGNENLGAGGAYVVF
jgi:hypothetical protein